MQGRIEIENGEVKVMYPNKQESPHDEALRHALSVSDLTLTERRLLATEYAHALNRRGILKTEEELKGLIAYLL